MIDWINSIERRGQHSIELGEFAALCAAARALVLAKEASGDAGMFNEVMHGWNAIKKTMNQETK